MTSSSLKFGTSGLRGLASDLEGQAARRYTAAFLRHLGPAAGPRVYLGRDFRPSSPAILQDCAAAIAASGREPVDCGALPTPALALHAIAAGGAAIMITGSHIPSDRNGLKFYTASGEIGKADEAGILAALDDAMVPDLALPLADEVDAAAARYLARFDDFLAPDALKGRRIGVFEHTTVARDVLGLVLRRAGAVVVPLGRRDGFVAVDTEAFGDEVLAPLAGWVGQEGLDALVSADGDGDRPLLMDETGRFVRGDVLGLLTGRFLGARSVVTPVTSNSAIERTGFFAAVDRTRVGSPYVIEKLAVAGPEAVGFEANGGTLVGPGFSLAGRPLEPLLTRDAVLPVLSVLGLAARDGLSVSQLIAGLPLQHALADRLQDVPAATSSAFLARLTDDPDYARRLFAAHGISRISTTDGLQFHTRRGETVHFRASGNAPEMRCYVESATPEAAVALLDWALELLRRELAVQSG